MKIIIMLIFVYINVGAQVENHAISGQTFKGTISINAASEKVWNVLTDVKKIANLHGDNYKDKQTKLQKIGDNFRMKEMGDMGTLLLSYAEKGKELHLTWEPDNGSYLCQERWTFVTEGNSTKVIYEERYTESSKQSADDISKQVKTFNQMLSKLKAEVETKQL